MLASDVADAQVIASAPIKARRHAVADAKGNPALVDVNNVTDRVDDGDLTVEGIQDRFE